MAVYPRKRKAAVATAAPARLRGAQSWRRHLRTTREGKAFIMVTVGVGFAAFNTGNNLLFLILGFMLSLIVLSGVMSETAIKGVRVSRSLPSRAFAGKTCVVALTLGNQKARAPSYSLEVEDIAGDGPAERRCYFLKVAAGAEQEASYRRTPKARGILPFSGFRIATRYPFGIFEKWRAVVAPGELLVYPALLEPPSFDPETRSFGDDAPTPRVGSGSELLGLRGYEVGDDARSIHWKRTASLGKLVVIERQSDSSSQLTILLDNARPVAADGGQAQAAFEHAFEHAISEAATLAVASLSRGLSVEVLARGTRSPLVTAGAQADAVLRYLALLSPLSAALAPGFGAHARTARVVRIAALPEVELRA